MDLHDFSRIFYTWTFKGESQIEKKYLDLSNLKYIQKDNEELVRQLNWHQNIKSVKEMEQKRKNW